MELQKAEFNECSTLTPCAFVPGFEFEIYTLKFPNKKKSTLKSTLYNESSAISDQLFQLFIKPNQNFEKCNQLAISINLEKGYTL